MSLAHPDLKLSTARAAPWTFPLRRTRRAETVRLFGLDLLRAPYRDGAARLLDGPRVTAAYVNPHCINVAARDAGYADMLRRADVLLPDGSGMAIAAGMAGCRFAPALIGVTDVFLDLMRGAAERGLSAYLLGSAEGVAPRAAQRLTDMVPGLRIAGTHSGFFEDDAAVIADINASGADILLVAMGVPLQERWIARNRMRIDARLAVGVGALFDFWSGQMPRAPMAFQRIGMEWVYRLWREPCRMAGRYILGNPAFLMRAARNALKTHRARATRREPIPR